MELEGDSMKINCGEMWENGMKYKKTGRELKLQQQNLNRF